jgi:predicted exporter
MGSQPGLEVVHPMAVVVLGGLLTTTFVTLFVLPALCARVATAQPRGAIDEEEDELLRRWADMDQETAAAAREKETAP